MIFELIQSTFRSTIWLALGLGLAACSVKSNPMEEVERPPEFSSVSSDETPVPPTPTSFPEFSLPDLGPAPDIANEVWLNTGQPLNLSTLRGKVVLVEFWTFG
jgi:hypothetical protein